MSRTAIEPVRSQLMRLTSLVVCVASYLAIKLTDMANLLATKRFWLNRFPIAEWLLTYTLNDLSGDFIAGVTLSLTMIPQALGYAPLAGLPIQYGLFACILPGLLYPLFGTTKEISIGPTAINSLMSFDYAGPNPYRASTLGFLTGLTELLMGSLNLGRFMRFISVPVMKAFGSAIGTKVITVQIKELFGLTFKSGGFIDTWFGVFTNIAKSNPMDAIFGVTSIVLLTLLTNFKNLDCIKSENPRIMAFIKKMKWLVPTSSNCFVVVLGIVLTFFGCSSYKWETNVMLSDILLDLDHQELDEMFHRLDDNMVRAHNLTGALNATNNLTELVRNHNMTSLFEDSNITYVKEFQLTLTDEVKGGLPPLDLPWRIGLDPNSTLESESFLSVVQSLNYGFIWLGIISVLNGLVISNHYAGSKPVDSSQEMFALGMCQTIASFTGAFPVTAAVGRAAVSSSSGVKSPLAGVVMSVVLLLATVFCGPFLSMIPISVLSAVLIYSSFSTIAFDLPMKLWKTNKIELFACLVTYFVGILNSVEIGLVLGFIIHALTIVCQTTSFKIDVEHSEDGKVAILRPHGHLLFPGIQTLRSELVNLSSSSKHRVIALDLTDCDTIDFTVLSALCGTVKNLVAGGQKIVFLVQSNHTPDDATVDEIPDTDIPLALDESLKDMEVYANNTFVPGDAIAQIETSFMDKDDSVTNNQININKDSIPNGNYDGQKNDLEKSKHLHNGNNILNNGAVEKNNHPEWIGDVSNGNHSSEMKKSTSFKKLECPENDIKRIKQGNMANGNHTDNKEPLAAGNNQTLSKEDHGNGLPSEDKNVVADEAVEEEKPNGHSAGSEKNIFQENFAEQESGSADEGIEMEERSSDSSNISEQDNVDTISSRTISKSECSEIAINIDKEEKSDRTSKVAKLRKKLNVVSPANGFIICTSIDEIMELVNPADT